MKKLIPIGVIVIALVILLGYFIYANVPQYENAIVHGRVQNVDQVVMGSNLYWMLNVSLDEGTHGSLEKFSDSQVPYPVKGPDGQWYYLVRVSCSFYSSGDQVYLRVPVYTGNVVRWPRAVQGYNYNQLNPVYALPAIYKEQGLGFVPVDFC